MSDDLPLKNIDVFSNSKISIKTWNKIFISCGCIIGMTLSIFITIISMRAIKNKEINKTINYKMSDSDNNKITLECYLKDVDNCKCDNVTYKDYFEYNMDILRCNKYFEYLRFTTGNSDANFIILYIVFGYGLTIVIVMICVIFPLLLCIAYILKCCGYYNYQTIENPPVLLAIENTTFTENESHDNN